MTNASSNDVTDVVDKNAKGTVNYDASHALVLGKQASAALTSAIDFIIDSPEMFELAGAELREIKRLQKLVEDERVTVVTPLNLAVKATNDFYRAPANFLADAEARIKNTMLTYSHEQDRLAEIARKAAEQKAREERDRLAEIERKQREQAEQQQRDADAAAARANEAAESGNVEQAMALQETANALQAQAENTSLVAESTALSAAVVTAMPAVSRTARVSGISKRITYSAQVDSLAELIKAVAAGTVPIEAIMVNDKFLNQQARAFSKPGQLYPGVRIVGNSVLAARAA